MPSPALSKQTFASASEPHLSSGSGLACASVALASAATRSAFLCRTFAEISRAASSLAFSSASVETGAGEGFATASDCPFSFCNFDFSADRSSRENVFWKNTSRVINEARGQREAPEDPHVSVTLLRLVRVGLSAPPGEIFALWLTVFFVSLLAVCWGAWAMPLDEGSVRYIKIRQVD